jgi:hypothetical protein
MIITRVLCEFATKPFPDDRQARNILISIEGRDISNPEFARALFCFQIAFYFLAWLAITEEIQDSSLQRNTIDDLQRQMREFFANASSRIKVADFIVDPAEQQQFVAFMCQQLGESDPSQIDISVLTTSKATVFDLVSPVRLRDYYDAMAQPNLHKFYVVAERVLFHWGAKKYQPVPVMVLANLLLGNYGLACKVVTSEPPRRRSWSLKNIFRT